MLLPYYQYHHPYSVRGKHAFSVLILHNNSKLKWSFFQIKLTHTNLTSNTTTNKKTDEKIEIIHGFENATKAIAQTMSRARTRIDMCIDPIAPSIGFNIELLKEAKVGALKRGIKIRYLTQITKDNIIHCKELARRVELRHIDGILVNFGVNDDEYMSVATLKQNENPISQVIYSNLKQIVSQHHYLFETLWNKATPAEYRIKEIEEGIETEFVEVITDGRKAAEIIIQVAMSIRKEAQLLLPHAMAMVRADKIGLLDYLSKAATKGAEIKIICPLSEQNAEIVKRISSINENIKIIEGQQIEAGLFIADSTTYCRTEDKDVNTNELMDAIGFMIYSNSKKSVNLFKSFFEALWKQMEMYEKIKTHSKMQKDFINIAAHELRTPIQPILGFAEILQNRVEEQNDRMYIETILRNARRLQKLAEEILDVARIESQIFQIHKEQFNLKEVILAAIYDAKSQNQNKDDITVERTAIPPCEFLYMPMDILIMADKNRISQVISNLINNAIRFTSSNRSNHGRTISISAEKDPEKVTVVIKDNGIDIDSLILQQLFTKFATKSEMGGTGLGLFISKSIIEAHGGKIWAENNKDGRGATFTFFLPHQHQPSTDSS